MLTTTMPTCADGELCKALSKELHGTVGMLAALGVVVACMAFVGRWKTPKAMR